MGSRAGGWRHRSALRRVLAAISQYLTILRAAGFVTGRRDGTSRLYRAVPAALGALQAVIEAEWQDGLDRLKRASEAEHRDRSDARQHADRDRS